MSLVRRVHANGPLPDPLAARRGRFPRATAGTTPSACDAPRLAAELTVITRAVGPTRALLLEAALALPPTPAPAWAASSVCRGPWAATTCAVPAQAGRSFCEIGTRNGDVMSCLSHFTKQLTSVEMDEGYCTKLRSRGISVACDNVER